MTRSITEIQNQLDIILKLEQAIETRIIDQLDYAIEESTGLETSLTNIQNATEHLAHLMSHDTSYERPILIQVMDGVFPFGALLQESLNKRQFNYQYQTMQTSSYQGTQSTGQVSLQSNLKIPVAGRNVYIIDEVVDTGKTYLALYQQLKKAGATEIRLVTLVDKYQDRYYKAHPWAAGFTLSKDAFIVGMGLDYNGLIRNLPFIGAVKPETLPTVDEQYLLQQKPYLTQELVQAIKEENASKVIYRSLLKNHWLKQNHQESLNQEEEILSPAMINA